MTFFLIGLIAGRRKYPSLEFEPDVIAEGAG